jgi:hypothetical protein
MRSRVRLGPKRRGYALIEMVVVITLTTALLGLGSLLVNRLMTLERSRRAGLEARATTARLERQFRRDVHAALDARAADGALVLSLPEGCGVTYRGGAGEVVVTREPAGVPPDPDFVNTAGAGPREETFRLAGSAVPVLTVAARDGRAFAGLSYPEDDRPSARAVRVEAAVGRDHRHDPTAMGGTP